MQHHCLKGTCIVKNYTLPIIGIVLLLAFIAYILLSSPGGSDNNAANGVDETPSDQLQGADSGTIAGMFPDAGLATAVAEALSVMTTHTVTQEELDTISYLHAPNLGISDLQGVERLSNVTRVQLHGNEISDISPLAGLVHLNSVDLASNQISDLSPLMELVSLNSLWLRDNLISDVNPLFALLHLEWLDLGMNQVSDLNPLAGLTQLQRLHLDRNGIVDITPLGTLSASLHMLDLSENHLSDLHALAPLAHTLSILHLANNGISDLHPLAQFHNMEELMLNNNQINDISPLAGLHFLRSLHLSDNLVSDLWPLANLTNLTQLSLHANQISDLSPLSGLANLNILFLPHNHISDLRPLAGLGSLDALELSYQQIALGEATVSDGVSVENLVFLPDGSRLAPSWISHGGVYVYPHVIWHELPADMQELSMRFEETVFLGAIAITFFGEASFATTGAPPPPGGTAFVDVDGHWAAAAIHFVVDRGLMRGMDGSTFAPEEAFSREMLAATLFRLFHGRQANETDSVSHPFTDVSGWSAAYITWAFEVGIVSGTGDTTFMPESAISRQDFTLMLYRFAEYIGLDTSVPGNFLAGFPDAELVGEWAEEAVAWAVANQLIQGEGANLNPQGTTNRAQAATLLQRFILSFLG